MYQLQASGFGVEADDSSDRCLLEVAANGSDDGHYLQACLDGTTLLQEVCHVRGCHI